MTSSKEKATSSLEWRFDCSFFKGVMIGMNEILRSRKHMKGFFFTAVMFLLLLGCGTTSPRIETANVTISLIVLCDSIEENVLYNTIVTLIDNSGNLENVYSAVATENSVTFAKIPFGTYTLKVTTDEHEWYTYENFEVRSSTLSHEVTLSALPPLPPIDLAEVTIVLIAPDDYSAVGAIVSLINQNDDPGYAFSAVATGNFVTFTDVPFGSYTLRVTHDEFECYSYEALEVKLYTLSRDVILVPVPQPQDYAEVTIVLIAPDGYSAIRAVISLINQNDDPDYAFSAVATSNSVTFTDIPFGTYALQVTHYRFKEYIYESLAVYSTLINHHVMLTLDSIDPNCRDRFDMRIMVHNTNITIPPITINWSSGIPENVSNVNLEIEGKTLSLFEAGGARPFYLAGGFPFAPGQTYQFKINYEHNGAPVEEILRMTFPPHMIISWPERIDERQIDLTWRLRPDDYQRDTLTEFRILQTPLEHSEMLPVSLKEFRIPAGLIPFPDERSVILSFRVPTSYDVSGRVSIQANSTEHSAHYVHGILSSISNP